MTHEFDENVKLRPVSIDGNFGDTLPMGSVYKNDKIMFIKFT